MGGRRSLGDQVEGVFGQEGLGFAGRMDGSLGVKGGFSASEDVRSDLRCYTPAHAWSRPIEAEVPKNNERTPHPLRVHGCHALAKIVHRTSTGQPERSEHRVGPTRPTSVRRQACRSGPRRRSPVSCRTSSTARTLPRSPGPGAEGSQYAAWGELGRFWERGEVGAW